MQIKYRVAQPFNFNNYSYVIVLNTSGDGSTPRANATQTAYQGYSIAFIVSGAGGNVTATAWYFYRPNNNQNSAPLLQPIYPVPGQLQFTLNSNGQNTEFTILFNRALASAYSTPTPSPTTSASPTATPTATPTPTPAPSGSPGPSPSATPTATPTPQVGVAQIWTFNYFVVQGSLQQGAVVGGGASTIQDSLGAGGGNDTTYTSPALDTLTAFDTGSFYVQPGNHPTDASADVAGGDITNNP